MNLQEFQKEILQGIPAQLPAPKPYDWSVSHAPKRKDILNLQKASNLSFCSGRLKPSRAWSSVDTLIYKPHFFFSSFIYPNLLTKKETSKYIRVLLTSLKSVYHKIKYNIIVI